jgi:MoxR-like ATPase
MDASDVTARCSDAAPLEHAHPRCDPLEALSGALHTLDGVLGAAVEKAAQALGPATLLDPWRGMHLDRNEVERLLRAPEAAIHAAADVAGLLAGAARTVPALARAACESSLSAADLAVLLITIAPEFDLKYERIYGYLQDDLGRKRATPNLLANLLATDAQQRLHVLARLSADAPLIRSGLLGSCGGADTPWLARPLAADTTWLHRLLGRDVLDPSIAAYARLYAPSAGGEPYNADAVAALRAALEARPCVHLALSGPHGAGKFALAQALAAALRKRVLVIDARTWDAPAHTRTQMLRAAHAAASLGALAYLHGIARLQHDPASMRALMEVLAERLVPFVVASLVPIGPVPGVLVDLERVQIALPSAPAREAIWRRALARQGQAFDAAALRQAASRFVLGPLQIEQAARDAVTAKSDRQSALSHANLAAAARAQCGAELAGLAQRITPQADFGALVVPPDVRAQLREICVRVTAREQVRREWDAAVHARAIGVTVLFAGPSGTGKTLAAEAVASELGFDLFRIDLATIVSKYIGETERNLERVFAAAEHANAVLFFDEADALFGKRSEVKDAHDRYANIEIAYLLQKMERFDGLAVLSTNLKQNLDEAFARRLTFTVNFPFPEQAERRRLWETVWPPRAPRAADVDLDWFAREFRVSGAAIRNVVVAAAHLAVDDRQPITRAHLLHAMRREFQKLGKTIGEAGLGKARPL